ncbi:MAG TPA: hypothetical protein VIE69_06940 [Methylophilaceae bacterium]|jgi:uncharacterized Zn finger protein
MAIEPIGYVTCNECGDPAAQVKKTKSGHLMVYCEMCRTQTFGRSQTGDNAIVNRMRPVEKTQFTSTEPAPVLEDENVDPSPPPEPKPESAKPTFKDFLNGKS